MGKRKKGRKKPQPKKPSGLRAKLPRSFDCPFCSHENSVECKMERAKNKARLECVVCGAWDEVALTTLMEPIDAYCRWIDRCQAENQGEDDDDDGDDDQYGEDEEEDGEDGQEPAKRGRISDDVLDPALPQAGEDFYDDEEEEATTAAASRQ
jgi:transcription elongation factor Elf1